MRITLLLIIAQLLTFAGCKSKTNHNGVPDLAQITFMETRFDYGDIPHKGDGKCKFEFENTSGVPLIINTVKTSCGCTDPVWPDKPLKPGEKGVIEVTYNTEIVGAFRKTVTVYSNTEYSPNTLFITGNVLTAKASN